MGLSVLIITLMSPRIFQFKISLINQNKIHQYWRGEGSQSNNKRARRHVLMKEGNGTVAAHRVINFPNVSFYFL